MSHHIDLAKEAQTRPRQTETTTTDFLFFLSELPKEHFSIIYSTVCPGRSSCRGNTPALMQCLEQESHRELSGDMQFLGKTENYQSTLSRGCLREINTEGDDINGKYSMK